MCQLQHDAILVRCERRLWDLGVGGGECGVRSGVGMGMAATVCPDPRLMPSAVMLPVYGRKISSTLSTALLLFSLDMMQKSRE